MADVLDSRALRTLLAPNPSPMTLDGTRTYVVGRARPVVIDPGPDDARHLEAIVRALGGARPSAIVLTHAHPDHAAGAAPLARRTGAPVWMGRGAIEPAIDPAEIDRWVGEGDVVETDAGRLRVLAAPGHTPEHLAFLWESGDAPPGGVLFVGDLMMGEGDTALVAPPEGDLEVYLRTLERIREIGPALLLPSHGPPLADPLAAVERYLAHRRERIAQAAAALAEAGPASPAELVDIVYGAALDPRLAAAAAGSLTALLDYLVHHGRARRTRGGRYAMIA
jgi:glyoxylase-like metal-dependent hydrolase (beta-lactamase superfamily II)